MSALLGILATVTLMQEPRPLDIDKLAYAVSVAESSACSSPIALRTNNCHGLTLHGEIQEFESTKQSYEAFKYTWRKSYKRFPDRTLAAKYSSEGAADTWLCNVRRIYFAFPLKCK